MELGVQGLNSLARFDATLPPARLAEELGYGSWWAHDHVVLPTTGGSPIDPATPIVDPIVHLAHVAAVTSRMTLGTAVIILPQRNPLVLAKQAASLGGRSAGAYRRAVSRAHGFYGNGTPEEVAGDLDGLRRAADEVEVQRYAALGVDRLVLRPEAWEPGVSGDPDGMARFLERHAHLGEP
jgi:hypothetical protein